MLVFRMDEQNFGDGERDGLRIATGYGLKVDFDEFAPDGDTLGLWHLHNGACQGEGAGLEDASGGGHHLVNHGAAVEEDGYRFVRSEEDYMTAVFADQPARSQMTFECWVRDWGLAPAADQIGRILWYYRDASNWLAIDARRKPDPSTSYISTTYCVGGVWVGVATWTAAEADAILASPEPWHVAAVLNAPSSWTLFVNGQERKKDTSGIAALLAGEWTFRLSLNGFYLSAVVDEVRLSAAARYAAGFTPHRLLENGAYASPTFDAMRIQADWLDLARQLEIPLGCCAQWEARAADETDAFGHPQALWQVYDGEPSTLPDGRYFQWRATLFASADRFDSPAIESVEAQASEAGYDLYHASGSGPECIDYSEPFARVGPAVREIEMDPLAAETVHWFGIRPVDARGIQSPITQSEARLEVDASGARVPDRPAGVLALEARTMSLGVVRLAWLYRPGITGVVPQAFRIFGDGGSGTIDYGSPLGEVSYETGRKAYAVTVEGLASGVEHQLAVRAIGQGEVWDNQPAVVAATPDANAPGEVNALEAEVIL
jgi:hypothetical protein